MRRTAGVTHVTIFTKPDLCGGNCLYCPTVPALPKSYLPHSNLKRHDLTYSSRDQIRYWLSDNERRGGLGSKLEVLILGGSFTAHRASYQEEFLRGIYEGVDGEADDIIARHAAGDGRRIIGVTVEARPNQITHENVDRLFRAGVTKIEIGVQSLDDDVLKFNDRGHLSDEVARATRVIKSAGLKVGYHLLFGMPGASHESDLRSALRVFEDARFQPDHLKIYICEMFKREFMRRRLVALFDSGEWRPLDREARLRLFGEVVPRIPTFLRISRIGRKVAGDEFEAESVKLSRADIEKHFGCACIRCREPLPARPTTFGNLVTKTQRLSNEEVFVEIGPENGRTCLGLLRLRLNADAGIVRELHVYGIEAAPGGESPHQHRGIGKRLMAEAERITSEAGREKLGVASGVGVRRYYEKLGYALGERDLLWKKITMAA